MARICDGVKKIINLFMYMHKNETKPRNVPVVWYHNCIILCYIRVSSLNFTHFDLIRAHYLSAPSRQVDFHVHVPVPPGKNFFKCFRPGSACEIRAGFQRFKFPITYMYASTPTSTPGKIGSRII